MTHTLKASDARKDLFRLMDRTERLRTRYLLTRDGKPQSVLMSAEEFAEWAETLEILADRALVRKIDRGIEDDRRGRRVSHEQVFGQPLRAKR